jgi:hypothetical protein
MSALAIARSRAESFALRPQSRPRARAEASPAPRALPNQVALKLSQGGEDVEDEPAGRGVRLDAFREGHEPDSPALQVAHNPNQVRQRSAEAVEPPDHQDIPRPERLEAAFELWPCGRLSRGVLLVDERAAVATEGVELQIEVLVIGRDAGVSDKHK